MLRITFLFSLILCLEVQGQSCLPYYYFNRQGQIDSFSILYPGCTEIEGLLDLSGNGISNFNGLQQLRLIKGSLKIYGTSAIDLSGLDSITSVGSLYVTGNYNLKNIDALYQIDTLRNLFLSGNSKLTDLSGLASLKVARTIEIWQMPITDLSFLPPTLSFKEIDLWKLNQLQSLNGFPKGDSFQEEIEDIKLRENPKLTNINGLLGIKKFEALELTLNKELTSLAGLDSLEIIGSIKLTSNDKLTSLAALQHVKEIATLFIDGNASLLNLHGLESITSIWEINIQESITSLEGLNQLRIVHADAVFNNCHFEDLRGLNLDTVYGRFFLLKNNQLINLDGLQSLKHVSYVINISENPNLITLSHLDSLTFVRSVIISSNSKLEDVHGFETLHEITGDLLISGNYSLDDISGISSIEEVDGKFQLVGTNLTNLEGLNELDTVKGLFSIQSNPILTDLSAIQQLSYVGELDISHNYELQNLPDFENLQSIPRNVVLTGNPALQSISGLHNLRVLDGNLLISENPLLTSLDGLDSVFVYGVDDVKIMDNPILSTCESPFMCRYIKNGKPMAIMNNAIGCNSVVEIEAQCGTLANSEIEEIEIALYPNPTSGSVYLTTEHTINSITVLDASGFPLNKINNPAIEIDLSPYPAGIYFMQLQMDEGVKVEKVIKN